MIPAGRLLGERGGLEVVVDFGDCGDTDVADLLAKTQNNTKQNSKTTQKNSCSVSCSERQSESATV